MNYFGCQPINIFKLLFVLSFICMYVYVKARRLQGHDYINVKQ